MIYSLTYQPVIETRQLEGMQPLFESDGVLRLPPLVLAEHDGWLFMCDWMPEGHHAAVYRHMMQMFHSTGFSRQSTRLLVQVCRELDEYFNGERREFSALTIMAGTEFQMSVWDALCRIPYGTTLSYSQVAEMVGCPAASRAVANAVGVNAMNIIVPCHRVVGSDHSLGGYRGGRDVKRVLLAIEKNAKQV